MSNIDDYRKELEGHDWFHGFSDDRNVRNAGSNAEQSLRIKAKQGGEDYEILWNIYAQVRSNKMYDPKAPDVDKNKSTEELIAEYRAKRNEHE